MDDTSSKNKDEDQENADSASTPVQVLDVKSTAVVKYTKMGPIETYSTLALNTDIKQPPHNWLQDNLQGRFHEWTSGKHEATELSSLNMAHTFPENVDEVDVISDAENIKKLLKMPFSKSGISLSVKKIGRTLLLDEFNVQNVLSQAAQKETLKSLTWLQDVFSKEAKMEKNQTSLRKKKNPSESRERNMMSKFLCYSSPEGSFAARDREGASKLSDHSDKLLEETSKSPISSKELSSPCRAIVPFLPEPVLKPHENSPFQRTVLWKFEDTKMLIGSNMPIFGGGKYPAVSLRLKDCSKPINVLTGLDYWLDNLMCNVPEVVMCFHLDGIVQKYEHYKTDELPNIEGSQFSPSVIKDVARNILSFLKSNCTLEGHTYWLFKGNGSDVVKLYDLTSLCDKTSEGESANPFSVPVAMLLYRVAKNMMNQSKITRRERNMIQVLLTNCLQLLNNEQHPDDHLEIITSSHYLLAEACSLGDESGGSESLHNITDHSEESGAECEEDEDYPWPKTLTISDLFKSNSFEETYKEVSVDFPNDVNEKFRLSLSHVVKALKRLRGAWGDRKFSNPNNESKRNNVLPSRPYLLALPDAGVSEEPDDDVQSFAVEDDVKRDAPPLNFNFRQWQGTFESILVRKAASLYSDLSLLAQARGAYGIALRYSRLSLGCLSAYRNMEWVNADQELDLLPTVLCGCGDVYMAIARSRDLKRCLAECEKDFGLVSEDDQYFDDNYEACSDDAVYRVLVQFTPDMEKLLKTSLGLYERALDVSTDERQVEQLVMLTKRLGHVRNELGLFCMNTAAERSTGSHELVDKLQELWGKSLECFNGAIRAFHAVDDRANIALVYSNCGRLMRTCAQTLFNGSDGRGSFDVQEKAYYTRALEYYQKSMRVLGERKSFPEVWDRVSWELSGTYYTMGTLVQDFTSVTGAEFEQCEKQVSDLMFKALKLSEALESSLSNTNGEVRTRIGVIHYRLGSLYHHSYRMLPASHHAAKTKRHLAELHYSKAADHINVASFPCKWLRANLERVALLEHHLNSARTHWPGAVNILNSILDLLLDSQQAFAVICGKKDENAQVEGVRTNNIERGKSNFATKTLSEKYGGKEGATNLVKGDLASPVKLANGDLSYLRCPSQHIGDISLTDKERNPGVKSFVSFETGSEISSAVQEEDKAKDVSSLVDIFESRLKNTLKEFIKVRSSVKALSSSQKYHESVLKRMFEVVLRAGISKPEDNDFRQKCRNILTIIRTLKELQNKTS